MQWRPRLGGMLLSLTEAIALQPTACQLGVCEIEFFMAAEEERSAGLFAAWLIATAARMLFWIDAVRKAAGTTTMP